MKKTIRSIICIAALLITVTGCSAKNVSSTISDIGADNSQNEISSSIDVSETVSDSSTTESTVGDPENAEEPQEVQSETDPEVGVGTIELLSANSSNDELSSGSYTVQIGNKTVTLNGAYVVDGTSAVITGGSYSSSESDQNVFLVINGGSLTLKNAEITKTGNASQNDSKRSSDVSDDYNFYGINSVILVVGVGSTANIEDCTITSDCSGANAIFSLNGANVDVSNVSISTTGNSSRGVYATYGGTITADHLDIKTTGAHCAPIATDRGGGYVTVKNSKLDSSGDGSPNIYSTGEITVENCIGVSTGAQAAVIEGKNSITMTDCKFTVSGSGNNGFMLYQSMSGDAADSDATADVSALTMTNTTVDLEIDVPMFYITNTSSVINLNGGNTLNASSEQLVSAGTGRWGSDGSNGGRLTLNINGDELGSSITADDISSVIVSTTDGGAFTGTTSGNVTVG